MPFNWVFRRFPYNGGAIHKTSGINHREMLPNCKEDRTFAEVVRSFSSPIALNVVSVIPNSPLRVKWPRWLALSATRDYLFSVSVSLATWSIVSTRRRWFTCFWPVWGKRKMLFTYPSTVFYYFNVRMTSRSPQKGGGGIVESNLHPYEMVQAMMIGKSLFLPVELSDFVLLFSEATAHNWGCLRFTQQFDMLVHFRERVWLKEC